MNYVRCSDRPIVYRRMQGDWLEYAPGLTAPFEPRELRFSSNGRMYHPAPVGVYGSFGSRLLLDLSENVETWGPYYSYRRSGIRHVIEPLEKEKSLQVLRPKEDGICFGCGESNPAGLALSFLYDDRNRSTRSWFRPDVTLQGAPGWLHGGFVALLLDEIMAKVLTGMGVKAPTVNLNVQYHRPCRIEPDRTVQLSGALVEFEGRKYHLSGSLHEHSDGRVGELLAEGRGFYIEAPVGN